MSSQIANPSTESFFKPARQFPKRGANGFPVGKRTEERTKQNRILNDRLADIKRHCEINLPHICVHNRMLTWCHATKSRFILTDKDWQRAARGCLPCHQYIENLSHKEMARIVDEAIKRRPALTKQGRQDI